LLVLAVCRVSPSVCWCIVLSEWAHFIGHAPREPTRDEVAAAVPTSRAALGHEMNSLDVERGSECADVEANLRRASFVTRQTVRQVAKHRGQDCVGTQLYVIRFLFLARANQKHLEKNVRYVNFGTSQAGKHACKLSSRRPLLYSREFFLSFFLEEEACPRPLHRNDACNHLIKKSRSITK